MFLDDIERGIDAQRQQWKHWDSYAYVDCTHEEKIIDFIAGIKLLSVKNVGESAVILSIQGMHTQLEIGEQKDFPAVHGRQLIVRAPKGTGRLFVGQARRGSVGTLRKTMGIVALCLCTCALAGCVTCYDTDYRGGMGFSLPKRPAESKEPQVPSLPQVP